MKIIIKSQPLNHVLGVVLVSVLFLVSVPHASAITITRNFIPAGDTFPIARSTADAAPTMSAGGGNLSSVFNAAADWWELALLDTHTFTVDFGWDRLAGNTLADATQFVVTMPGAGGDIRFDSDRSNWFIDSTPHDNSEYTTFTEFSADLGGGTINTGRVYTGATGDAAGNLDLLSVAKHEIGHLLGITNFGDFTNPSLTTTAPRPNAGTVIPTDGGHIDISTAALFRLLSSGERNGITGIDILAAAEVDGFTNINLDPGVSAIPIPSSFLLFVTGLLGLIGLAKGQNSLGGCPRIGAVARESYGAYCSFHGIWNKIEPYPSNN